MKAGDVHDLFGLRMVCVPDYLLSKVGVDPETTCILLPPDAADALVALMRKAGIVPPAPSPATPEGRPLRGEEKR